MKIMFQFARIMAFCMLGEILHVLLPLPIPASIYGLLALLAFLLLGMTKTQVFFRVVLLQVIKRIIPSMGNEIITLVKDTALARVIAVYEVTWAGETFIKKGLIWPLFYTGLFYLLFSGLLTVFFGWVEKKLNYFRG